MPTAMTTSATVVAISHAAPSTSPVMPPNARSARLTTYQVDRIASTTAPTSTAIIRWCAVRGPSTSASAVSVAAPSTTAVHTSAAQVGTVPATRAPSPSGRAARTRGVQAQRIASRPVTTARMHDAVAKPETAHSASAVTWMSTVNTIVRTPNAPTSGARITASRRSRVVPGSPASLTPSPSA